MSGERLSSWWARVFKKNDSTQKFMIVYYSGRNITAVIEMGIKPAASCFCRCKINEVVC